MVTVVLEEADDGSGDLVMPIPQDMLENLGWQIGDTLTWTIKTNGSIILSKKAKDD